MHPASGRRTALLALVAGLLLGIAAVWLAPVGVAPAVDWLERPRPLPPLPGRQRVETAPWTLLTFGFTRCRMSATTLAGLARLEPALSQGRVEVVFVSVDVERDSGEAVAAYAMHFHPRFIGVILAPAALSRLAAGVGARFAAADGAIGHSVGVFVIDPDGRLRGRLRPGAASSEVLQALSTGPILDSEAG